MRGKRDSRGMTTECGLWVNGRLAWSVCYQVSVSPLTYHSDIMYLL